MRLLPLAQRIRRFEDRPGQAHEESGTGENAAQTSRGRPVVGEGDAARGGVGKLLSPERRPAVICESFKGKFCGELHNRYGLRRPSVVSEKYA